ncbi:DNA-directed RNA polymerase specialized sigma subunit [Cytobacillus horneckiae]|uniref:helix-turn-helix transcriptional regulator n=1 Tax=Cytobacillus horneckiae TaxID=549687 RepID=UPI001F14B0DF|nr:DNA-binding response regulator [Cytobacillus horneckiae]
MKEAASKQIKSILKDYYWMMNSIKILRDSMKDAGEGLTAQYGDESAMPKAQGTTSDPIFKETVRREKRYRKIAQYEDKVKFIQNLIPAIDNDREGEVLHWLLEGKSYRWIGMHMGLSSSHIHRLRDSIVERMAQETNGTNGTNDTKLINHKSAC